LGGGIGAWSKNYWDLLGLDYTIPGIPINIALDTGPHIGIINSRGFGWGGGLAIRYVLK